uniref:(California timema) hypothetical protein n=1 Tax=Timema californicum TaxID=61474 RepID=A0A7R9J7W9_TIMCA|nr:unnamed protein product [Timema californicum]
MHKINADENMVSQEHYETLKILMTYKEAMNNLEMMSKRIKRVIRENKYRGSSSSSSLETGGHLASVGELFAQTQVKGQEEWTPCQVTIDWNGALELIIYLLACNPRRRALLPWQRHGPRSSPDGSVAYNATTDRQAAVRRHFTSPRERVAYIRDECVDQIVAIACDGCRPYIPMIDGDVKEVPHITKTRPSRGNTVLKILVMARGFTGIALRAQTSSPSMMFDRFDDGRDYSRHADGTALL